MLVQSTSGLPRRRFSAVVVVVVVLVEVSLAVVLTVWKLLWSSWPSVLLTAAVTPSWSGKVKVTLISYSVGET
jgi:hypothetical protein